MQGLIWLALVIATIIPMVKILPHFGINKMWAALCVIPLGLVILLWMIALRLQDMEKR
ncbi:MAG: hypothetical protein AAF729_06170 [Pseudomonadota bacterium]